MAVSGVVVVDALCLNSTGVSLPRLECGRTSLNSRRQLSITAPKDRIERVLSRQKSRMAGFSSLYARIDPLRDQGACVVAQLARVLD